MLTLIALSIPSPTSSLPVSFDAAGAHAEGVALRLAAWGREESLRVVPNTDPEAGIDVIYRHSGVDEWWTPRPGGFEHGFTVAAPPVGDDLLVFDLACDGALTAIDRDGAGATLFALDGTALRYAGISAWDSLGTPLPAWMEGTRDGLRLLVDDAGAVGAVTVDPLLTALLFDAGGLDFGTAAGDVNADGYADTLDTTSVTPGGAVFVLPGSSNGLLTAPSWVVREYDAAGLGESSGAGDVNGDGFDDVLVTGSLTGAGGVDLYFGSALGPELAPAWQAAAVLATSLAGGDSNADGYSDIAVGESGYLSAEGRVALYAGSATTPDALPLWEAGSGQVDSYFGHSVALGDFDGDGFADVVVGAHLYDNDQVDEGRAFVYLGTPAGPELAPSWTAESDQSGSFFGWEVASAGDTNGDGYADLLVGAPYWDGGEIDEGAAFVYDGSLTGPAAAPTWSAEGDNNGALRGAYFGIALSAAGDVDADGYDDIVIGAPNYSAPTMEEGAAWVFLGSTAGLTTAAWSHEGGVASLNYGAKVAGLGDVNGDSYDDIGISGVVYYGSCNDPVDTDLDGHGDLCDRCPGFDDTLDADGDLTPDDCEQCPGFDDADDADGDGVPTGCDDCTNPILADTDLDGFADPCDACAGFDDAQDADLDLVPDACDPCSALAFEGDADNDGTPSCTDCDDLDPLMSASDPDRDGFSTCDGDCVEGDPTTYPTAPQLPDGVDHDCDADDTDALPIPELCDNGQDDDFDGDADCGDLGCAMDSVCCASGLGDGDGDGWCDGLDVCPLLSDAGQEDSDGDGTGDLCDVCPPVGTPPALFGPQQLISTQADGPAAVLASDLDGDGDADVLCAAQLGDEVAWYENLTGGAFSAHQVISSADGPQSVYATDLDGDGDPDVLSASNFDDTIAWYENLGGGAFGPQLVITPIANGATEVFATDLDGDGDADVLWTEENDDQVSWSQNLGGGLFGAVAIISSSAAGAQSVYATDLDGDGDADVLSGSQDDDKVAWYANLGGGLFGAEQVISFAAVSPQSVYAADLDGDGDADVLSGSLGDDKVAWYENWGNGLFGPQQVISTLGGAIYSVYATDLDGDGDVDVLSVGYLSEDVSWHENLGGGTFGTAQEIGLSLQCAQSVTTGDLDGDGDADVLTASQCDDHVAWFENLSETMRVDTDGDGVSDTDEVWTNCTDPLLVDTDGGGESDGAEAASGTDPLDSSDDGVVVDADGDGFANALDCDDANAAISPAALEVCDVGDVDENCDGFADDDDVAPTGRATYYYDTDGDGYGGPTVAAFCDAPPGFTPTLDDCDDADSDVHPFGNEVCDVGDIDEDCDGLPDDADSAANGKTIAWFDADVDGFGGLTSAYFCTTPAGWFADAFDCDDANAAVHPGAEESDCADLTDYNCDGSVGLADLDLDGYPACEDCNDDGNAWYPGAPETDCLNPQDRNCDGSVGYADADLDGSVACADCNDGDAATFPGAAELVGDGIDEDCNGVEVCYVDVDSDGFRPDDRSVASPDGTCDGPGLADSVSPTDDCDDLEGAVYPGAPEADCSDPVDYNCDGSTNYADADADGFAACVECNDGDPTINPDAPEQCNQRDDNCDGSLDENPVDPGTWYADADGDGFIDPLDSVVACEPPPGYRAAAAEDCDDDAADVFPDAVDIAGDGIDQDCNGADEPASVSEEDKKGCTTAPGGGGWALLVLAFGAVGVRIRRQRS